MTFTSQMYLFPYTPRTEAEQWHEAERSWFPLVWVGWWGVDTRALHTVVRAAEQLGLVEMWDDASTRGLWYEARSTPAEKWLRARCAVLAGVGPVEVIENRAPTRRL